MKSLPLNTTEKAVLSTHFAQVLYMPHLKPSLSNLTQSSHKVSLSLPIVQMEKLRLRLDSLVLSQPESEFSWFQAYMSDCCSFMPLCLGFPGATRLKAWPPSVFSWHTLSAALWSSSFLILRSETRVLQRGICCSTTGPRRVVSCREGMGHGVGPSSASVWLCDLGNAISQDHVPAVQ